MESAEQEGAAGGSSALVLPSSQDAGASTSSSDATAREALQVLDTLVEIGQLSSGAADAARRKVAALHAALAAAASESSALAEHAQQLEQERTASGAAAADAQQRAAAFEGVSVEILREDVETALAEAALAQERAAAVAREQQELQQQRDQLAENLDSAAQQHAEALAPAIAGLQETISELRRELEQQHATRAASQHELDGVARQLQDTEPVLAALRREHKAEAGRLTGVAAAPDKARRQADRAVANLAAAQQLLAAAEARAQEAEAAARAAQDRCRQKQVEHAGALGALERGRILLDAKERQGDDVQHDLQLAGLEGERILGDHADAEVAAQALAREARSQREALARAQHEKVLALRGYKAAEDGLAAARGELPGLKNAQELAAKEKAAAQTELAATTAEKEQLRKQVDARIAAVLKEEGVSKDKAALLGVAQQEVLLLEQESAGLKDDDRQLSRLLGDMMAQRDRVARFVASQQSKVAGAHAALRLRAAQVRDLEGMLAEQERREKELGQLLDLVRNQSNRFVATIASARQAQAEVADRLRLLASEREILSSEAAAKAELLSKAQLLLSGASKEREALHNELHSLAAAFSGRHTRLREQGEAIEGARALLRRTQAAMAELTQRYEAAVAARNATGLMLIDRNDELAVLHERAHLHEAHLSSGTLALAAAAGEARVLGLQLAEAQRCITAARAGAPDVDGVDCEVAALKAGLLKARRRAAALGDALEDPSNTSRIRLLASRIPEKEELVAKLQAIEERLGMQSDAAAEKGLVLEEAAALTAQLREAAASSRPAGAALGAALNACQERLRRVTRETMAAVSELSLYQATALKLHATKCDLEEAAHQACTRLAAGQAPTDDADAEWAAQQRQAATLRELRQQRDEVAALLDQASRRGGSGGGGGSVLLVTAAEPRPNAYIPPALGIPRPYGAFAPFKPAQGAAAGAAARHARRPEPLPVVI